MIERALKVFAAAAFFFSLATQAPAEQTESLDAEVEHIIAIAADTGPYRRWDDLRMAMPRNVRWHLAPPDEPETVIVRRTGWIEVAGRQIGVAACGVARGPELLTLRIASAAEGEDDPAITRLEQGGDLSLEAVEPSMSGELRRYRLRGGHDLWFEREISCTPEGGRAARRCAVSYTLDIRPPYRNAPAARECRAP